MHDSFLEYVLEDLGKKQLNIASCTFVLPSKRSGTFLKQHISKKLDKNMFSPEIMSIQEFIEKLSGLRQCDNIDLLLSLYTVYKNSDIKQHEDFSSFIKWGQTLLHDFNEIDGYLIPAKDILNYLSAIKELNHWSLKKEKTELVENYLQLWGNLEHIYEQFTTTLLKQKSGHQGLIHRVAVQKLSENGVPASSKTVIFIGFNALNNAESLIVQHYLHHGRAHIYWDIDNYFLNDPIHDAGLFIRNYLREWPYYKKQSKITSQDVYLSPKKISITGVPKNVSQTKYVGQLLQELALDPKTDLKNTALVLADETLLRPMLRAIPDAIGEVNITMGHPLDKTVLHSFFLTYLELCLNASERGWFYKNVLEFISNPYTLVLSEAEKNNFAKSLARDIKEGNWLYVAPEMVSKYNGSKDLMDRLFTGKSITPKKWTENCLSLIQHLKQIFQSQSNALELEYLYRFHTLFNQLGQYLEKVDFIADLKSIKNLFRQLASMETLDFIGEPLSGLQIMGMLESRNLDFETVIITSVNEGILPSGKSNNSFIPFDVKRDYGLPTYKEKDAIYTYHFYRLIQRAKNVHIIYNTEQDVLEGGEKSRLISQLLTDANIRPYITHSIATPQIKIDPRPILEIHKDEALINDIKIFAANGFSPTSLTNYIKNPIDFYTRNILKINDLEEVEENIAANTFGTIVHDSLEQLYTPLIGSVLTKENLSLLKSQISAVVAKHFQINLSGADISKGKFLLVYNVIIKYLQNFIQMELELLDRHEIKILALEEKYGADLQINGLDFPIKLKGTLDRVDVFDGTLRIIDYKTGRVEPKNVKMTDWEELVTNYDKSKAFQLLCYALLYHKTHRMAPLLAGIYSFKSLSQGLFSFTKDKNDLIDEDILVSFEGQLKQLITEICNPEVPLTEKLD